MVSRKFYRFVRLVWLVQWFPTVSFRTFTVSSGRIYKKQKDPLGCNRKLFRTLLQFGFSYLPRCFYGVVFLCFMFRAGVSFARFPTVPFVLSDSCPRLGLILVRVQDGHVLLVVRETFLLIPLSCEPLHSVIWSVYQLKLFCRYAQEYWQWNHLWRQNLEPLQYLNARLGEDMSAIGRPVPVDMFLCYVWPLHSVCAIYKK